MNSGGTCPRIVVIDLSKELRRYTCPTLLFFARAKFSSLTHNVLGCDLAIKFVNVIVSLKEFNINVNR